MLKTNESNKAQYSKTLRNMRDGSRLENIAQSMVLLIWVFFCMLALPANAITPADYGAVAGDQIDDTAAVQSAIDNNDEVELDGLYRISSAIRLRSNLTLHSHSQGGLLLTAGPAGFDNRSNDTEFDSNANALLGTDVANIELRDFRIIKEFEDGSVMSAVRIRGGRHITVSGLEVSGFSNGLVIALDSVEWASVTSNIVHSSYTSSETQHTAIAIDSSRLVRNGVIINSQAVLVSNNYLMGLEVSEELRARNRVETDAINIAGPEAHDIWVLNNSIASVGEGIDSFGQRVNIRSNAIYNSYLFGIKLVHGASESLVRDNTIVRPAKVGIVLAGSNSVQRHTSENLLLDNFVSGAGQSSTINWRPQFTAGFSLEANGGESGSVVGNVLDRNRIAQTANMDFGVLCEVPHDNIIRNLELLDPALREGVRGCL